MTQMQLDNPARHEHRDSLHDLKHPAGLQDRLEHVPADGHPERLDLLEDDHVNPDGQALPCIVRQASSDYVIRKDPLVQYSLAVKDDERALRRSWVYSDHDHLGIAFR